MSKLRSRFKPFDMQAAISIATISLILLILLLAYTMKHAREQDRVRQFGERHAAIAGTAAAGIEDAIAGVRESLLVFSKFAIQDTVDPASTVEKLRFLHENMKRQVRVVATTDPAGNIVALWPEYTEYDGAPSTDWVEYLQAAGRLYELPVSSLVRLPKSEGAIGYSESAIVVRVERYDESGKPLGAILALVSLNAVMDRYGGALSSGKSVDNWLFGNNGTVMVHSNPYVVGMNMEVLSGEPVETPGWRKFLASETAGYQEFIIRNARGDHERMIVAASPIFLEDDRWTIALVTPYSIVVELMRKVFLNIATGAVGLIILLIIAGLSVGYMTTRQMKWEETLKRLKEREEWQGRLIREHKTIEGIIEGSPIPTMVIGHDHRILLWNKALAELTGYESGEMVGTDKQYLPFYKQKRPLIADIIVNGDLTKLDAYYGTKQVKQSHSVRGAYEAYDFYENLGGKDRFLYFLAAPIYDASGGIIAAIETLQDITKEKDLERSLKEYTESLQNELEANIRLREEIEGLYSYLQSIIDALPEKIFDISGEGIINYVSRENIAGKKPMKGTHFVDFVSPENREFVLARWEDGKQGVFKPYQLEVLARDGSKRLLLITPRPVPGTNRVLLVQQDITEIRQLQKTIFDNEKLAALGHLSAGIAHELRNALSSIKMSLQILERRMAPAGNDLKRFQIAQREVEHLSQLVRDVLLFAKPADPEKEPAELETIVEHSLAMVEKELADNYITVRKNYEENLPAVDVDQGMVSQALLNILLNAVQAMDRGGELTIRAKRSADADEPGMVVLEIEDNGCGIAEEHLSSLFNPFFSRKKYGTGLGLAQVKKIMDVHHGHIDIFSSEGTGTRVVMRVPAAVQSGGIAGVSTHDAPG